MADRPFHTSARTSGRTIERAIERTAGRTIGRTTEIIITKTHRNPPLRQGGSVHGHP